MEQIIRTKLFIPRLRPQTVARPHLTAQLDAGLSEKLTLVAAPAGFGKTTLVAEWVTQSEKFHTAWLSLDASDDDLLRFLIYVVEALRTTHNHLGADLFPTAEELTSFDIEKALTALVNELAAQSDSDMPTVLVLDDYHVIEERSVHDALTFLLTHAPSSLHFVIITRVDPPLPLARLRARRQMTEIREAALRFSEPEAEVFLNERMMLDLASEDIATLEAKTEGWIANLQLAALAMQSPTLRREERHAFVADFAGSDRYVADYLVGEVLDHQPREVELFLLQTAILDRLCASLCDTVRGEETSQAILETLERANLFVQPQDNQRTWFRYHHLFADLLRHRLSERYPEQVATLHGRASEWYEMAGNHEEAIPHALAASDHERAARLIEPVAHSFFSRGKMMILHRWLSLLPGDIIRAHPRLYLLEGWLLVRTGRFSEFEAYWQNAPSVDDENLPKELRGELFILNAHDSWLRGEFDRCQQQVDHALVLVQSDEPLLQIVCYSIQGWVSDARNQVDATIACFARAVTLAKQVNSATGIAANMAKLVQLYASNGRAAQAKATFEELYAYTAFQGHTRLPLLGAAHIGMGLVRMQEGNVKDGEAEIREGIELCKEWGGLRMEVMNGYVVLIQGLRAFGNHSELAAAQAEAEQFIQTHETPEWMVTRLRRLSGTSAKRASAPQLDTTQVEALTQRESDVLHLLAEGRSAPQIADELIVGVSTVRTHIKRIYAKLAVHSRREAIERAREFNLI